MNKVLVTGRFTKDVETRYNNETIIVRGTLAVGTSQKDVTSFVNILAFNKIGEILEKYTKKVHLSEWLMNLDKAVTKIATVIGTIIRMLLSKKSTCSNQSQNQRIKTVL